MSNVAILFISLLFAASQSIHAAPMQTAPSNDPAELAASFVRDFSAGTLSVESATALMGAGATARREGAYWQIRRKDGQQQIVMRATEAGKSLNEAELRLDLNAGLLLSDLEMKFGPGKVVSEGKTSSVSFRVAGTVPTVVLARLLTPTAVADSPVMSLELRRDPSP